MGQKVNPNGFRYGVTRERNAIWYADKEAYSNNLIEDIKIRTYINKFQRKFMIGEVKINRSQGGNVVVHIFTARPGALLGQGGNDLKTFTKNVQRATKNHKLKLSIDVIAIERPELWAKLVAEEIAIKLENRASFRIAQKMAIRNTMKAGAKGIKTAVAGRLNGADMARTEWYSNGSVSLHTLRQEIDFGSAIAKTTYGAIGVKVWISKKEILNVKTPAPEDKEYK